MGFPSSTAKTVFLEALEIASAQERQALLDVRCGGDASLRREVDELLAHHGNVGGFLETPPTDVADLADTAREARVTTAPTLSFLLPSQRPGSLGRLGHYEILETIGSGGFGVVLKAHDEKLQRIVAIKSLAESLAASATARRRFVREAQNAAAVRHDNVVGIFAVEEAGAVPYLVMELVDGISLEDKLQREGPLELKEVLRIGMQIANGLAAAHKQGLVHRDVKPANILLENGIQRVKITDFGLARGVDDASLTQTGLIAGTPSYMSPEQARGERVDARSDLFSLGSVLYALCTGQVPFQAGSSLGVAKKVCEETPQPVAQLNPAIPPWLSEIVERLHAKDPARRFQSAEEVAGLLGNYLAQVQQASMGLPVIVTPHRSQKAQELKRRWQPSPGVRRWLAVVAAALILIGAMLGFTEARGVTQLAATIIRIFTPEGTLVVEVDDPGVKVTVEGDGGLVITGAGLHEVHLRPGKYQLRADKDGQRVPLSQELVTISRGDKQVVRARLELPPLDANAWGHRGRSSSGLNQLDEAIADFSKAIELGPRIAWLWADRGDVYAKRQDWDRAIADCSQAVRLEPNTQWICSALMSKYAQAQRFDQAAVAADQALSVVPVPEDAWRGNPPLVVAAAEWKEIFERLVKLRPQDPRPWAVRIELLASRGKWQEASELLSGLMEVDGGNHWAWYSASVLHLQTGNADGYRHVCGEMLQRFGDTADVFIADRTAKTLLLMPGAAADVEVPRKLALLAAARAPSNQWFHLTSGLAEYRAGNFEAAGVCLRKSISTPAGEPYVEAPSLVLLAMSQHRLGRKDEAIDSLKRADQLIAQRVPNLASGPIENWGDWIRLKLFRREAAALIEPQSEMGKARQELCASRLGVPIEITNSVGMTLRLVPPGEFVMGTAENEVAEVCKRLEAQRELAFMIDAVRTEHRPRPVVIAEPFYAGTCEVTVGQFKRFVSECDYRTDGERANVGGFGDGPGGWARRPEHQWRTPGGWEPSDDQPVVQVSWDDARAFCAWLGKREGRTYTLPTEVQWEYAARAGTTARYGEGSDLVALDAVGWVRSNRPAARPGPQPVAQKRPNAFGLYDTHGNVWEWSADPFKVGDRRRAIRGGAWYLSADHARIGSRGSHEPDSAPDAGTGFRVILVGDLNGSR